MENVSAWAEPMGFFLHKQAQYKPIYWLDNKLVFGPTQRPKGIVQIQHGFTQPRLAQYPSTAVL